MRILTKDGRILWIYRIGEIERETGTNKIFCESDSGKRRVITFDDVAMVFDSYTFSNHFKK